MTKKRSKNDLSLRIFFVQKTRDQPKPGSLFGKMRDPGNEVASTIPRGNISGNLMQAMRMRLSIFGAQFSRWPTIKNKTPPK